MFKAPNFLYKHLENKHPDEAGRVKTKARSFLLRIFQHW